MLLRSTLLHSCSETLLSLLPVCGSEPGPPPPAESDVPRIDDFNYSSDEAVEAAWRPMSGSGACAHLGESLADRKGDFADYLIGACNLISRPAVRKTLTFDRDLDGVQGFEVL